MIARRWILVLLAVPLLFGAATAPRTTTGRDSIAPGGHVPPPLHLQFEISKTRIRCLATLYTENFELWWKGLGKGKDAPKMTGPAREKLHAAIIRSLEQWMVLRVDGIRVPPRLEAIGYIPPTEINDNIPFNDLGIVFPVKAMPDRVNFEWLDWKFLDDEGLAELPVVISVKGDPELMTFKLDEDSRGTTWHAPKPELADALRGREIPMAPPQGYLVPLASLALALSALVAFGLTSFRALARPLGWRIALGAALCAAVAWPLAPGGSTRVRPPWIAKVELPDESKAKETFETLHRNIYRAFDYEDHGRIYDVLAESVDGPLLDALFQEVYDSLILREHEGARAKVTSVKMLKAEVRYPDPNQERFAVNCRWRVQGRVEHWGHEHLRTNEYQATYGLLKVKDRWKIASLDLEDQKRWGDDVGVFKR